MTVIGNETSFYAYTTEWIKSVDRGGLFSVNDACFVCSNLLNVLNN